MSKLFLHSLFLLAISNALAAPAISITPNSPTVQLGSEATFDINLSGLELGISVGTFDLSIAFDPAKLGFARSSFGTQLDLFGIGDVREVTQNPGSVELFELSLESVNDLNKLQSRSFRLASLSFHTLATATNSPINLSIISLGDAEGLPILADSLSATVTITAVPEPASYALCLAGLALVGLARRRAIRLV